MAYWLAGESRKLKAGRGRNFLENATFPPAFAASTARVDRASGRGSGAGVMKTFAGESLSLRERVATAG
jgi:hypothetical protein